MQANDKNYFFIASILSKMSPSFITPQKNISLIRISILEPARSMAQDLKERSTGFLFLFVGAWGALATFLSCVGALATFCHANFSRQNCTVKASFFSAGTSW